MRIAVFASGNGSNFQVLAEQFPNNVKLVFSDHRDAFVLQRAEALEVAQKSFELKEFANKAAYETKLVELLQDYEINLVVLAGYMKIIGPTFLAGFKGQIINIHPSLLPDFAGSAHAIEESHAANRGLGVTVHFVDEGVDTGKIIAQVSVEFAENLAIYEKRVHEAEYELYPRVIKAFLAGEIADGCSVREKNC